MKNYGIRIPMAGSVYVIVSADSEKEAIEIAFKKASKVEVVSETLRDNDIEEFTWDCYEKLHQGNVRLYSHNEVEVNEDEEDEDEYEDDDDDE